MASIASTKAFRERHEKKKQESARKVSEGGSLLKKMASDGATASRILVHNGIIAGIYGFVGFLVCYATLQIAFYFVAILAGSTGAYLMETQADVLTAYVILAIVCGFCLFFAFQLEKAVMRAAKRRFWRKDRKNGGIDRGPAWAERHPDET